MSKVHVFESAGLGKAPFTLACVRENVFTPAPGMPGKPGGTCQYCSTGIRWEFVIESADKKRFVVGSDCVMKTDDAGLKNVVDIQVNRIKREARMKKESDKAAKLRGLLFDENVIRVLRKLPHPMGFKSRETGLPMDMYDWATWMSKNAGASGRASALRKIELLIHNSGEPTGD